MGKSLGRCEKPAPAGPSMEGAEEARERCTKALLPGESRENGEFLDFQRPNGLILSRVADVE